MRYWLAISLLLLTLGTQAQIVVVVAKDAEVEQINEQAVTNIFMSKTKRLPNGQRAVPLELHDAPIKTRFYESITGKSSNQLNAYWTTLVFTGKGQPPQAIRSHALLRSRLLNTKGAIAYMEKDQVTEDLKIIHHLD